MSEQQQSPNMAANLEADAAIVPQESGDLRNAALSNPGVLASLQKGLDFDTKLEAMAHYQGLPEPVKRRIRAMKKLQFRTLEIEAGFYKELHELEMQYANKYEEQLQRRSEIINGNVEPTDEDANWPEDSESELELAGMLREKANMELQQQQQQQQQAITGSDAAAAAAEAASGVPEFWLTVLKNVDLISHMIREQDEPILRHLTDIRIQLFSGDQSGFQLQFQFSPNDYFTNELLTKHYYMRMDPDKENPWSYEGPEIVRCSGCEILWKKGKNVTVKVVKKVQKHKGSGQKRTVTKTVEAESFFNFFNPPSQSIEELNDEESKDSSEEEIETMLHSDFEIGHYLRDQVVPRAVLFFTGEGLEDEDFEDDEDDEDEDMADQDLEGGSDQSDNSDPANHPMRN